VHRRGSGSASGSSLLSVENDGGADTSVGGSSGTGCSSPCAAGGVGGTERAKSESETGRLLHGARSCNETVASHPSGNLTCA